MRPPSSEARGGTSAARGKRSVYGLRPDRKTCYINSVTNLTQIEVTSQFISTTRMKATKLTKRFKLKKEVICMEIKKVMVIGAGQMGAGIAQVCAQAGFEVLLNDLNEQAIEKGINNIVKLITRAEDMKRITTNEKKDTLKTLNTST